MAGDQNEMRVLPAGIMVDRTLGPLDRGRVVARHVTGDGEAGEPEEDARIPRVHADRDALLFDGLRRPPDQCQCRAKTAAGNRTVRVQLDRMFKRGEPLLVSMKAPAGAAESPLLVFVPRVELRRTTPERMGRLRRMERILSKAQ